MTTTFAALGVPADIARRLAARGIDEPFPIQAATIPDALDGRDLCGKAPTGSGKTIAFGVPMVAAVTRSAPKRPKGLVLTPTRELALQVADELRALGGDLRVLAVYGGAGIEPQIKQLRAGVDIVVACPGRLLDVIERKACDLRDVRFAVVDEADRMADMGFLPDVRRILDQTNQDRQTLLFSATLDGAIDALVKGYQSDPVVHEMPDDESGDVVHHFWASERQGRAQLTAEIIERVGPTVVFSRTRHGADRIAKQLGQAGVSAAPIHGGRSQAQRERALAAFHRGEVKALVATDVAARGIHVEGVACVVHFDIPADPKDYVHRSGRTGRAGALGTVVALVPIAQKRDAAKLRKEAGVEGELREPAVGLLPEGHAAFKAAASRPAAVRGKVQAGGGRAANAGRSGAGRARRDDDRFRTDRPTGADARPGRPHAKAAKASDQAERSSAPRTARADAGDRAGGRATAGAAAGGAGRPAGRSKGPSNRAERRQAAFGEADSPERRARAEAKAARGGDADGRADRGGRGDGPADLDRALAGSPKVRPSGASRRKAKREALVEAGLPATGTKRRRSGKPRPPATRRG
ncbi:MAG TPA: DEAD/DEAH box helicase [Aquihabitans sp.]|jgi:superfamily II DNA/RNA helicase|nr:DEAD/DEAH box helicase [Aquihabitans sp.]